MDRGLGPRRRRRAATVFAGVAAMATALVTGAGGAQTNVLQNGDFGHGLSGWTKGTVNAVGSYPHVEVETQPKCDPARAGNPFAAIDVPGGSDGYFQQSVTVPAAATLTFETWGNLEPVQASVSVITADHVVHPLLGYTPPLLQSAGGCSGLGPISKSIDMAQYAGQTVTLRFEATSTASDGTLADFDTIVLSGAGVETGKGQLAPVSGQVLVQVPGSNAFVALSSLRQVPFGTVIDATHGRVIVTTAAVHGGTQTAEFFEGQFVLTQAHSGLVTATLSGGDFSVCPTAHERAHKAQASSHHASGKHVVRRLWASAHGSFSTKGTYAAGAVQGTEWLTEDLCEGTLIRVTRDKVLVTSLVNHHKTVVKAGHSLLVKAP